MFANRIKELVHVKSKELAANPRNWRQHPERQQKAIRAVLESIGIAGALLARETDQGYELIDGHLRTGMDPEQEWPVLVLDVDEQEANAILATFDPIAAMAETNAIALRELILATKQESLGVDALLDEIAKDAKIPLEQIFKEAPEDFPEVDENIDVNCTCPKCGYQWSDANRK